MRFITEFSPSEKIALELMVALISSNKNLKRKNSLTIENAIRKRFYNSGKIPEKLLEASGVSFNVLETGAIVRGGDHYGNIFDDLNYGDAVMTFDNPHSRDDDEMWSRVFLKEIIDFHEKALTSLGPKNPLHEDYILGEIMAWLNLAIMFEGYEKYFREKGIELNPNEEVKQKKTFRFGEIAAVLLDSTPKRALHIYEVSENDVEIGARFFFRKFFGQLGNSLIKPAYTPEGRVAKRSSRFKGILINPKFVDINRYSLLSLPRILFLEYSRKMILNKLNYLQIYTRQFMCDRQEKIYVVIKPMITRIAKKAAKVAIPKELELGSVDIISMFPVDECMRPFIYKSAFFQELLKKEHEFLYRNPKLLVEDCSDIKQGSKLAGRISGLKNKDFRDQYRKRKQLHSELLKDLLRIMSTGGLAQTPYHIMDNRLSRRRTMEPFYIFCNVFHFWGTKLMRLSGQPTFRREFPFLLRLLFMKALHFTNQSYERTENLFDNILNAYSGGKRRVRTIWDYMGTEPTCPYMNFSNNPKIFKLFKTYEINEKSERSVFTSQERVKMTIMLIEDIVNIEKLKSMKVISEFFPIHDRYLLYGEQKSHLMKDILAQHEHIEDSSGSEDDEIAKPIVRQTPVQTYRDSMLLEALDTDFIGDVLSKGAAFGCKTFFWLPIEEIRNYFGEKIALYFYYLNFQTKMTLWASIMVIVLSLIEIYLSLRGYKSAETNTIFVTYIVINIWGMIYVEQWYIHERMFSVRFGQEKDAIDDLAPRKDYKSRLIRDFTNNEYNAHEDNRKNRFYKFLLSLIISGFIIFVAVSIVFCLLWLKWWMKEKSFPWLIIIIVPSLLNVFQIKIFNEIYSFVATQTNIFENHRLRKTYENSMIIKLFSFTFVNTFNSFFIISFMKGKSSAVYLSDCISGTSNNQLKCFSELGSQVKMIFIVSFFTNFLEIVIPQLRQILIQNTNRLEFREYSWGKVDRLILAEARKETYERGIDLDGTLGDYMSLILEYSFLLLFGISFPMAFPLALLSDIAQTHIDKFKFFYLMRRPVPKSARNIGTWNNILNVVNYAGIFVSSAIVVYTMNFFDYESTKNSGSNIPKVSHFFLLSSCLLVMKRLIQIFYNNSEANFERVKRRHKTIVSRCLSKGKSTVSELRLSRAAGDLNLTKKETELLFKAEEDAELELMNERLKRKGEIERRKKVIANKLVRNAIAEKLELGSKNPLQNILKEAQIKKRRLQQEATHLEKLEKLQPKQLIESDIRVETINDAEVEEIPIIAPIIEDIPEEDLSEQESAPVTPERAKAMRKSTHMKDAVLISFDFSRNSESKVPSKSTNIHSNEISRNIQFIEAEQPHKKPNLNAAQKIN